MSEERDPETDQALPIGNDLPVMHELVREDLQKRLRLGISKYGQPLQPFNGRSFLRDAYEEVLDLAVYLRGAIYEAENERCPHVGAESCDCGKKRTPQDIFKGVCMECLNQHWIEDEDWKGDPFGSRSPGDGLIPCPNCNEDGEFDLPE